MSTNTGQNWTAVVWLVMSAITAMDTGTEKTVLLAVGMVIMALIAWRTTGSGLSPKESQEILDTSESIQDVLKRGRDD
ncbi:MAG: hypothetical protein RL661_905 [Pseudomonadota bacterium]